MNTNGCIPCIPRVHFEGIQTERRGLVVAKSENLQSGTQACVIQQGAVLSLRWFQNQEGYVGFVGLLEQIEKRVGLAGSGHACDKRVTGQVVQRYLVRSFRLPSPLDDVAERESLLILNRPGHHVKIGNAVNAKAPNLQLWQVNVGC